MVTRPADRLADLYPKFLVIARGIAHDDGRELLHDTLEKILAYDDEHLERILQKPLAYMKASMALSYRSKRGGYQVKRKPLPQVQEGSEGIDEVVILRERIDTQYRKMDRVERAVFKARFEDGMKVPEIARCMGYSERRIRSFVQELREKVIYGITQECVTC
jgi:DNA-directed RNA polymerase specialized sigma24 family protein